MAFIKATDKLTRVETVTKSMVYDHCEPCGFGGEPWEDSGSVD